MNHCNVISFPRSGQHLLQSILEYICLQHRLPYQFCEYYSCCKTVPCCKESNFIKNHDFHDKYIILNDQKYIVLYRKDMILQLEAFYRNKIKRFNEKYDIDDLKIFYKNQKNYYSCFVKKWVENENPNIMKIEYYNLIENPIEYVRQIFQLIYPGFLLNDAILEKIPIMEFEAHHSKNKIQVINTLDTEIYNTLRDL